MIVTCSPYPAEAGVKEVMDGAGGSDSPMRFLKIDTVFESRFVKHISGFPSPSISPAFILLNVLGNVYEK